MAKQQGRCAGCGEWIDLWDGDIDCHMNEAMDDLCPGSSKPPTELRRPTWESKTSADTWTDEEFAEWCEAEKPCRYCGQPFVGPNCPCEQGESR